jgi:hypothetical protein
LALVHGFMHEVGRWTVGRQSGAWCALHVVLLLLHSLISQFQPIVGDLQPVGELVHCALTTHH